MLTCEQRVPEILAPVGGPEQLSAAVRAGADAVYLGLRDFNARGSAHNFDADELGQAVRYAHARGVKVHVTLNTLIRDDETDALVRGLKSVAESGADAVIVQDLAVAALARELCPSLSLHASTQTAVHNLAGVRQLERLGFKRVVLARELSLDEIKVICRGCSAEVEVFVHGALCMSVSGNCWLSSMIGGRSGNRGRCAQPCRLNFRCGEREYALSLKDMSHIDGMAALADAGVRSLKIEGRMKGPDYVAAAVTACRLAREGRAYDKQGLRDVFSRGGFTDGYLTGKRTLAMFGRRTPEDVRASAAAASMGELYKNEYPGAAVDMRFSAKAGEPVRLSVSDGARTVSVEGGEPEAARSVALDAQRARASLEKTGGTPFYLNNLSCEIGDGVAVKGGELNRLRREALEGLLGLRSEVEPHPFGKYTPWEPRGTKGHGAPGLRVRVRSARQLPLADLDGVERVILPLARALESPETVERCGGRLAVEIPALVFPGDEEKTARMLERARALGVERCVCENIGAIRLAEDAGLKASGGHSLNIYNTRALDEYAAMGLEDATLSFELRLDAAAALGGALPRGIVGYGCLPLMRMRVCPSQTASGCAGCGGQRSLVDRRGERFTVLCADRRYQELLNALPLYVADKPLRGLDFVTLFFTTEDEKTVSRVIADFKAGRPPAFKRTTGLYFRTVE